jgi:hypothetical protein
VPIAERAPHLEDVKPFLVLVIVLGAGCASSTSGSRTARTDHGNSRATQQVRASHPTTHGSTQKIVTPLTRSSEDCIPVVHFEQGKERGVICLQDARGRGLTVIDLTDAWTPTLFAPSADGQTPSFRARYLALAAERGVKGIDALTELYGIVPALSIVRARLADDERHACHAAIDPQPIAQLTRTYSHGHHETIAAQLRQRARLAKQLERARTKHELTDIAALEGVPEWRKRYERYRTLDTTYQGLLAAQRRLHCEGWLRDKEVDASFTWRTGGAVERFQRRNFLIPNKRLDDETRDALLLDSRELDFRLSLRVLRERVVEAAGLLEDGTAGEGPVPVLGRMLDPSPMRAARGHEPLANAAPDLIGAATEVAARQLGWTSPDAVRALLERNGAGVMVAIELPPPPRYHAPHMELFVEIDRGDVYYDERPRKRRPAVRPSLVVYAQDGDIRRPLVRWATTIGGWADERLPDGRVVQKWKESDVGPRIWRDVTAAPAWLPPKTTPDRELVRTLSGGRWALKSDIFGPGPRSAYGMVMVEHLRVVERRGSSRVLDNGIRTHGSSSVTSILHGTSHGCHRLYNHLATRLGNFVLQHRDHTVKGEKKVKYRRWVSHKGTRHRAAIDSRGFQYELTPPVEVEVTEGRILTKRKKPPKNSAPASP